MDEKLSEAPAGDAVAQAPSVDSPLPGVPAEWPGAFGAYKYSKRAVRLNLGTLIILWLAVAIISGGVEKGMHATGGLISSLISALAAACYAIIFIAGVRRQRMSIGEVLSKALPLWLKMIGLGILVAVSLVVSLLLLVIPFFFVLPRLSLAHYFLVDKNLGVMEAYKASWAATKGYSGKVWGIIGATILMALLAITIIGIPFSIYFLIMYSAAYGVLYEFLNKSKPVAAPAQAPASPTPPTEPEIPTTPAPA
jgi:hypothetical protein